MSVITADPPQVLMHATAASAAWESSTEETSCALQLACALDSERGPPTPFSDKIGCCHLASARKQNLWLRFGWYNFVKEAVRFDFAEKSVMLVITKYSTCHEHKQVHKTNQIIQSKCISYPMAKL